MLCSACSEGSSQHSSGADKQLRARHIRVPTLHNSTERILPLLLHGHKTFLANQQEKVYLDFAPQLVVVVITDSKVMLLFGRGLWLMFYRNISSIRDVEISVFIDVGAPTKLHSSLPAVNDNKLQCSVLKTSSNSVPPDWFLPGPTGLRGPLLNDVRLSLRPPPRWKLP